MLCTPSVTVGKLVPTHAKHQIEVDRLKGFTTHSPFSPSIFLTSVFSISYNLYLCPGP